MIALIVALVPIVLLHLVWLGRRSELLRFQLLLDLVLAAALGTAWLPSVDLNPVRCLEPLPPYTAYSWDETTTLQPAQGDLTLQMHPWWAEVRDRLLHSGQLAWLSERIGAGTPLLANGQVGLLAPPMLPVWVLGPESGTEVMAVWKLELGGLGMFLLLRRFWRLRFAAAAVGGVIAAAGPFMVGWLLVPLSWNLAALPWLTWLLLRATARRAGWLMRTGAVAACTALVGTGLHPESALVVVGGASLTAVICRPRGAARLAGIVGVAACLTVLLTLPSLAAISASSKAHAYAVENPNAEPIPAELRWAVAAQGVLPAVHGHPGVGRWTAPYPYPAGAVGIGCAALVLVGVARPRRRYWRLTAAALACLYVPLEVLFRIGPLGDLLVWVPPLDRMTLPRFAALLPWALALLASLAVDSLIRSPRRRWPVFWLILVVCMVTAATQLPSGVADRMLVAVSLVAGLSAAVLAQIRADRGLPVLVAVELAILAIGINPTAARTDRIPRLPVLERLQAHAAAFPGRIIGVDGALRANVASRYGLSDLRAFDPVRPLPLARLHAVLGASDPVLPGPVRRAPARLLGAWSVRYLVAPQGWHAPEGWEPLDSGSDLSVWTNRYWQPEVRVVRETVQRTDRALMTQLLSDPSWLVDAVALAPDAAITIQAEHATLESLRQATAQRVVVDVVCDGTCVVAVARAWSPGWSARVDGRVSTLLRVNLAGMGTAVPAGHHRVELVYEPYAGAVRWLTAASSARRLLLSTHAPDSSGAKEGAR